MKKDKTFPPSARHSFIWMSCKRKWPAQKPDMIKKISFYQKKYPLPLHAQKSRDKSFTKNDRNKMKSRKTKLYESANAWVWDYIWKYLFPKRPTCMSTRISSHVPLHSTLFSFFPHSILHPSLCLFHSWWQISFRDRKYLWEIINSLTFHFSFCHQNGPFQK